MAHRTTVYFPRLVSVSCTRPCPAGGAPPTRSAQSFRSGLQCLSGGLGALGLVVSRFFLELGNQHLVVTSRSVGKTTFDPQFWMSTYDRYIGVHASTCDISSFDDVV
jgi:hypothetical protein